MATKKTATKKAPAKKVEKLTAARVIRDAWLAGLGSYVKAYELAKDQFEDVRTRVGSLKGRIEELTKSRDELVKELINKGENIETLAEKNIADARTNVVKFAEPRIEKIKGLIPVAQKGDRVTELEAEIEKLNKKIATLSKPAAAKTAAKKPAAKKAPVKKAPVAKAPASKASAPKAPAKAQAPVAVATETKAA